MSMHASGAEAKLRTPMAGLTLAALRRLPATRA